MIKMILEVEGMSCGMCESHINDTVRKQFEVKKVVSSHKKGKTEIIAEAPLDETQLRKVIGDTGYEVKSVRVEPYTKKGLFWYRQKKSKVNDSSIDGKRSALLYLWHQRKEEGTWIQRYLDSSLQRSEKKGA